MLYTITTSCTHILNATTNHQVNLCDEKHYAGYPKVTNLFEFLNVNYIFVVARTISQGMVTVYLPSDSNQNQF